MRSWEYFRKRFPTLYYQSHLSGKTDGIFSFHADRVPRKDGSFPALQTEKNNISCLFSPCPFLVYTEFKPSF